MELIVENYDKFTCFIIGDGTLPIRCGEILLKRGHRIFGIVSADTAVQRWAQGRQIACILPSENLSAAFSEIPFDYLFSIVNEHILPDDVLVLPRRLAINYHDAPLPKYAGRHATSWALLNHEMTHGVTWHVMTDLVDGGDILKQQVFRIEPHDTALRLNAKCYEAASDSFAELIADLALGRASLKKQDLNDRNFYSRYRKPPNACLVDLRQDAHDIDAFIRALNFGPYPNALGVPRLALETTFLVLQEIEVLDSSSEVPPGRITKIHHDFLRVSTADRDIAVRKISALDGEPIVLSDLVARFNLYEGYQFSDFDPDRAERIEAVNTTCCLHELFWLKKLESFDTMKPPYARYNPSFAVTGGSASILLPIPDKLMNQSSEDRLDFLLAAYGAYLARLGDVSSFDIGFTDPDLRRQVLGLEEYFACYVPCRISADCFQPFSTVLCNTKNERELIRHHETFSRDLVARYPSLRSKSQSASNFAMPVVVERVTSLEQRKENIRATLALLMPEVGAECCFIYDPQWFDETSIARLVHHFAVFLQGLVADPHALISSLSLLTSAEAHRVLVESNDTRSDYPKIKCIHELFEAQAEKTPDAVAVTFEGRQLSYKELNERANQVAHYLQKQGVGPEALVAICVERSLEMIIGLLGILKAGGAYVPLDPQCPKERLAFMLEDTQVSVLLTQQSLVEDRGLKIENRNSQFSIHDPRIQVIYLDRDWGEIRREPSENIKSKATAENLAYVIYTSGSTGKPKGVLVTHHNVTRLFESTQPWFHFNQDDVWTLFHSYTFDFSVWEIWGALLHGGRLVIVSYWVSRSPEIFYDLLRTNNVTVLNQTPSAFQQLMQVDQSWQGSQDLALRWIIFGGELLNVQSLKRWFNRHGDRNPRLVNMYGITETTVHVTYCPIEAQYVAESIGNCIGKQIPDLELYLLDQTQNMVPIGVPGEIYVGGAGVARGYLNRPELTADRFVQNPFGRDSAARLYRTGDRARYLPDGNIEFLGRTDSQVKVRGYRVELGEIESVLSQHPAIQQAVVLAREDTLGDKRLVAYFVAAQDVPASAHELRSYLQQRLPEYMVPSSFIVLESLPLTSNGKVDRQALPALDRTSVDLPGHVGPRNIVEEIIASVWSHVLGTSQISIHDNFFHLGGHSLLATQVLSRLRNLFQCEIPLRYLFEFPTISELAAAFDATTKTQPHDEKLRRLLTEIEALSEKEAQGLLARKNNGEWTDSRK